jgi:hypothetical protein
MKNRADILFPDVFLFVRFLESTSGARQFKLN